MPRAGLLAVFASAFAAVASAQVPSTLSPRLATLAARPDTTALVWVVARPRADLATLAARITAAGGQVRHVSRFATAVSASVPSAALAAIARLPGVRRVQPVGVWVRPADETCGRPDGSACRVAAARPRPLAPAGAVAGGPAADTLYGTGGWAVRQLNVPALHALGLRGAGVRIALLDGGFNTFHPYMAGATIVAQRDFVYHDSVVRDQPNEAQGEMSHGTSTWSLIAANAPGRLFGEANQARFLLAKTEFTPTETRTEEDNWVAAVEWADSIGVDIISSSLGYLTFDNSFSYTYAQLDGDFAVTSMAADSAAKRGILVVVSVGNDGPGPHTLGTPADADSIVAVGATDSLGRLASFSSRGPTADARHKPEVVAPGVAVTIAATDSGLARGSGTSFSAPLIAGLAALVQGARLGRPAADLRRGLLAAAANRATPNDSTGWGLPDAVKFLAFPTGLVPGGPSDTLLSTLTPTFDWLADQPSGFAPDTFRLRVAIDSGFALLVLDTVTTASSVTLPFAARPAERLYWRLDARSPLGVGDSAARRGPFTVPAWATLLTLASPGGSSTRDSVPTLAWHVPAVAAAAGPVQFDVAVYPASGTPAQAVASASGLTDTVFAVRRPLEHNLPFRWRVVVHVGADSAIVSSAGSFVVLDGAAPAATLLFQNFPNPFPNPAAGLTATCIWFDIAQGGDVRLGVFDLRGRLVRTIAPGPDVAATLVPGHYGRPPGDVPGSCDPRFAWDGRDETGAYVRQGVYLYRLVAPGFRDAKRIVFLGAPSALSLVTVGTGTVAPSATRSSPAHWVERDGLRLLLDCGPGTVHRLARFGLAWEHVTHIALSHFHPDHFGELPALLFALRHATTRVDPLVVLGPPGTVQLVRRLADGFGAWMLDPGYPIGVLDVQAGEPFPLGTEATLDVHPTPHTPESVALAVQAPEGRIVYTGDTGPSEDLGRWAAGADLLLAECSVPDDGPIAGHLTPAGTARLARMAGPKQLVLTHFYPQVERVDIRAVVAREFHGPVTLANDGDRFTIG